MSEKKLNPEMEAAALTEAELNDAAGGLSLGIVRDLVEKAADTVANTTVDRVPNIVIKPPAGIPVVTPGSPGIRIKDVIDVSREK